jgi:hypothetical protein
LIAWLNGENSFSWKEICEWIASIEATVEGPTKMEMLARGRVRAVLEVNVHCDRVVRGISHRVGGDEQVS